MLNEQFRRMQKLAGLLTENEKTPSIPSELNLTDETSGMMEEENLNEDKPTVGKMKDLIYQDYREIVDSGQVEKGTEEWLFLLQLALKVYGLDIQNEYDILKGIDGKGPYAKQIKALGYSWIRALEIALSDLEVEAY
jgi:hypothetical protein